MSGFFFNPNAVQNPDYGCVTCGCSPCVYTDTFDLAALDSRWKTEALDGGTAPVFSLDDTNDKLEATGDGSFTLQVTAPANSHKIWVEAEIEDISGGGATETGVIVGKLNSGEEIILVRVWGTANGYELRQGTAVLQTFTDAGGNPIRLEITSPHESTTDVKCYIGGVLVHTETGVVWELPGALYLGAYSTGGGRWAYVSMSPCPKGACSARMLCAEFTQFPLTWTLDATEIGGTLATEGCETGCENFAHDYTFLISGRVVSYITGGFNCNFETTSGWIPTIYSAPGPFRCTWFPVYDSTSRKPPVGFPDIDSPGHLDDWPVKRVIQCGDLSGTVGEYTPTCWNNCFEGFCYTLAQYGLPVIQAETRMVGLVFEVRVSLLFIIHLPDPAGTILRGQYYSPWVTDDGTTDYSAAPTVLTLDDATDIGCEWPEELTLVPNGNVEFARRVADCDPCSECEGKTKKRAWAVEFEWQDLDAQAQFEATRMYKCLNTACAVAPTPDRFLASPWLFRPETDCGWILCGSAIRVCDLDDFDAFGTVTNPDCSEYLPTPAEPTKQCCRTFDRPYVTMGYAHQYGSPTTSFELIIWEPDWDRFDGVVASGPWTKVLARYTASGSICTLDKEITFTKTEDNSVGTVGGGNPYNGLAYFPDTLIAARTEMPTDCDGPATEEPEPLPDDTENWCPGEGSPPLKLWFDGVDPSPTTPPGTFECLSPEPYAPNCPGDLDYDGVDTYTGGNLTYVAQCATSGGYVEENTTIQFSLVFDDIDDPMADAWIDYTWASQGNTGSGTVGVNWTCPPFEGLSNDIAIAICSSSGETTHVIKISIHRNEPAPSIETSLPRPLLSRSVVPIKKAPEDVPCVHRGGYLQTMGCCGDLYQCKNKEVFARTGQRACTINENISGYQSCVTCPNREETSGTNEHTENPQ